MKCSCSSVVVVRNQHTWPHLSWKQELSYQPTDHLVESSRVKCLWRTSTSQLSQNCWSWGHMVHKTSSRINIKNHPHLSRLLARHGGPHIDCGATGAEGWRRDVGCEWGSSKYNSGVGLTAIRRWRGSSGGRSGCVRACRGCGRVGCEAVASRGGLRWDWLACPSSGSGSSIGSYSSCILTDLLHKIPHKVRWKSTYNDGEKEIINKMSFFFKQEKIWRIFGQKTNKQTKKATKGQRFKSYIKV